jgi:AbrB family looped-hinge helix DNA binding protein
MRVAMDKAGRVVIPRSVRDRAHLRPGAPLDIRVRDGVVELEPAPSAARLEKRGKWTVAVPGKATRLTQEQVDAVMDEIRYGGRG